MLPSVKYRRYLSVEKKTEGEKRVNYYSWGERARYEVDKDCMLAFVAEVCVCVECSYW